MEPGTTAIDLGFADRAFGADQFYGDYPSWERTKTWFADIRQSLGESTEVDFAYRRNSDLFVLFRDDPQIYQNDHLSQSWQAALRRRKKLRGATTFSTARRVSATRSTRRTWACTAACAQPPMPRWTSVF